MIFACAVVALEHQSIATLLGVLRQMVPACDEVADRARTELRL